MKTLKILLAIFNVFCFLLCLSMSTWSMAKGELCTALHQLGLSTYYPLCWCYWQRTIFKKEACK